MPEEIWRIQLIAEDNLDQLQQRIRAAKAEAGTLGGQPYTTQQKFDDQQAERVQKSVVDLARAQERAALSGMSHGQKLEYLRTELNNLTPDTRQYYQVQTQLNQEMQRGGGLAETFGRQLMHVAIGIAIWGTFRQVQEIIQQQIQAMRDYSLEVARFAAITGQSLGEATAAWDEYASIAAKSGVKPMEAAPAIRIAELTPNETEENRKKFIEVVSKLSELTGETPESVGKGLSSAMRQANLDMGHVVEMGDLIATTLQRIPAATLKDVIAALQEASPLAQLWGISFEDAFKIIVDASARLQESPEQVATSFQRLSKGYNELSEGGEKAWDRQSKLLKDYGLNVLDAHGKLRPVLDVLREVNQIVPTLSASRKQDLLETLAGGSLRAEQTRNILGGLESFSSDLDTKAVAVKGSLDNMTETIDQSLGQMVKVLDARIAQLQEKEGLLPNLLVSILRGTVGEYGGKQGAQLVTTAVDVASSNTLAESQRKEQLQSIVEQSGGDVETAKRLAKEYNDRVIRAVHEQRTSMNPVQYIAAAGYANMLLINDDEVAAAMEEGGKRIEGAATKRLDSEKRVQSQMAQVRALQVTQEVVQQKAAAQPTDQATELGKMIRTKMFSQEGQLTGEDFFPGMGTVSATFDATKMTQDEINTAKQKSIELVQQELQAHREFLATQGLEKEEIDKIIEAEKERLDLSYLLVRTKEKTLSLTGEEAARFQQAASDQAEQKRDAASNFAFQRFKDFDPARYGQLLATAQMYDQFLTNIGSPEKKQQISLLLGEDNVFKTMNVRMTALQLAMEDLTKVQKQLSGTWNLPSGATALVPISSLDIQRWNKSGGGGISEEAIRALLGATASSGDKVATATTTGADRIVAAIGELRGGRERAQKIESGGLPEDKESRRFDPADEAFRYSLNRGSLPRDQAIQAARSASQNVNVTVSQLPVKTSLTAVVNVILNGNVVARTLVPYFFDMFSKSSASAGSRPKGMQR